MRAADIETIRASYNRIADSYVGQRDQFASVPYLERFAGNLPAGGTVLDVGCGGGLPVDAFLSEQGLRVHGLDLSERMIALARKNVPDASFEVGNMLDLCDGQFSVDGVVSFYAIFHTPRTHHQDVLTRLASFLPTGGVLLITMGAADWEGTEDFHGEAMHWSHFGAERNAQLVESAGFEIVRDEIDHSGDEAHQVILALRR
jgi:cyclopropane fatty-acyl-phospholipid synthase-like methyltransferase